VDILHICAGWEKWNGAANIARLIMNEQRREGHEVSLATWTSVGKLRMADEVWIHCSWKPCLWWAARWGKNVHWVPECSYDPIRRSYHGWKKALVGPIERFFLRRAKVIVATCESEKGWIQSYLGKYCPPVEITDVKRFFNLRNLKPENSVQKSHNFLYLGRRHPLKGLEYLEEAVKSLEFRVQSSGGRVPGPEFQVGGRECVFRMESNVFGEEKERVWAWCDVLVLPTLSENFGLVVAEALERGKRVITTDGAPAWGACRVWGGGGSRTP